MKRNFTPAADLLLPSALIIRQNILPYFVLMIIPSLILTSATGSVHAWRDLTSPPIFGGSLLTFLLIAPLTYLQTKSSKGREVSLGETLKGYRFFLRLLIFNILFSILLLCGFLLFIIPGFIILRRYFLTQYYIIDDDISVLEAMKRSAAATKQNSLAIYGLVAVLFLFFFIGVFGRLGAVVATLLQILYSVAPALRYQEFRSKSFKAADI